MSSAQKNLLRLAELLSDDGNVTHWAISMRLFGKGDFFRNLKRGSVGVDIAARNDLFVIWVLEDLGERLVTREVIAEKRISFAEQDALLASVFDILDAMGKGYSFTEIVWDTSSLQWQPVRLEYRDPRWFRFQRHDLATPMMLDDSGQEIALPAYKFIYAWIKAKSGLALRSGLARLATWNWMFKAYTGPGTRNIVAVNSSFLYQGHRTQIRNAVSVTQTEGLVGMFGVDGSKGQKDGFGYHFDAGAGLAVLHVNCISADNGRLDETSINGFTTHDTVKSIDIGGPHNRLCNPCRGQGTSLPPEAAIPSRNRLPNR